ncbi:MAG: hypothetical protein RI897_4479 [Verrucomicrobiota bacterium]
MSAKIHRTVQNPHDLEDLAVATEQNDVLPLCCELATGKQIIPGPESLGVSEYIFELGPQGIEIEGFLLRSLMFQGVISDRSDVGDRGLSEVEDHDLPRAIFRNWALDRIRTVSPASSWA